MSSPSVGKEKQGLRSHWGQINDLLQVFSRCLDAHEIPAEQRPSLLAAYSEITLALKQDDSMAE